MSSSKDKSMELSDHGERINAEVELVSLERLPPMASELIMATSMKETVSNLRFAPKSSGGAFILDIRHGHCYSVNQVGLEILRGLSDGQPESRVIDNIAHRFGTLGRESIEKDVKAFGAKLRKRNLL